MLEIVQGVKVM